MSFNLETTLTGNELAELVSVLKNGYEVTISDSVVTCSQLAPSAKMTVKQLAAIAANKGIKLPARSKKGDYLAALGVDTVDSVTESTVSTPKKTKAEPVAELVDGDYVSIPIKPLKAVLSEAKKFVSKRPAHPVLQYYKIAVKSGFVRIHSADETFYECDLPATCAGDWETLVSPTELESLCKGKGFVYITEGVMWNTIGTRIEYAVNESPNEYPSAPPVVGTSGIITNEVFKQGAFAHLVKAKEITKAILTGVNYRIADGIALISATDGFRLYTHTVSVPSEVNIDFTIKADISAIDWQGDLLISSDGDYLVILDDSGRAITTRILTGDYPDVKSFTPVTYTGESIINCKQFIDTVKQLYIAAGKENDIVQLSFKKDSQQLVLGINKDPRDHGSTDMVTASICCHVTEDIKFNLNVKYLKELAKLEPGDVNVTKAISYGDNKNYGDASPFIIKTGTSLYLLMDVQTKK